MTCVECLFLFSDDWFLRIGTEPEAKVNTTKEQYQFNNGQGKRSPTHTYETYVYKVFHYRHMHSVQQSFMSR